MRNSLNNSKASRNASASIDDMGALLDHIEDFTRQVLEQKNQPDDQLLQEWGIFKQYLQWKNEDLVESSHFYPLPDRTHHS